MPRLLHVTIRAKPISRKKITYMMLPRDSDEQTSMTYLCSQEIRKKNIAIRAVTLVPKAPI